MRETPYGNRMKARQMFLDAHKPLIEYIYCLPSDDLKFDKTVTEVMQGDIFVGDVAIDFLMTKEGVDKVLGFQEKYRNKLISVLEKPTGDYVADWNTHMDYEAIIMDKMLDLKKLPAEALTQPSAKSFYTQQRMFSLMHQGYQQIKFEPYHERSQWFSQFNDTWFFKSCATKYRLIDILEQYTPEWETNFAKQNEVEYPSLDNIFESMKDLHRKIIRNSTRAKSTLTKFINKNPHLSNYMKFVSASIEYNEELRLMRSGSVVSMIHGARHDSIEPYQVFLDVLADRKDNLQKEYGKLK
jgi:hypothetical protein